jgi:hypothetical protein
MEPNFETKDYVDFEPAERTPKKISKSKERKFHKSRKKKKVKLSKRSITPAKTDTLLNIQNVPSIASSSTKTDFTPPPLKRRRLANLQAKKRIRNLIDNESTEWEHF